MSNVIYCAHEHCVTNATEQLVAYLAVLSAPAAAYRNAKHRVLRYRRMHPTVLTQETESRLPLHCVPCHLFALPARL